MSNSKRRLILQLLIAGAVVHACLLIVVRARTGRIDSFAFSSLDCGEFYALARNLAEHGAFSQDESAGGGPPKPDTWRTPGYPVFLAMWMLLFGDSPAMLVVVQQLLSVVNVLLVFWVANRWMGEKRAAIVAVLFLLEPYHLFYSLWLMATTLFVTVLLLTWHAWYRSMQTRRWWWFALLGVLSGFLVLVRPVAGIVPILVFAGLLIRATRPLWPAPAAFAVAFMLVVGSWMTRNHSLAGHFALSHQGGVVLAYFKATEVVLWRDGRTADRYLETALDPAKAGLPHAVWEEIDARLRSRFPSLPEDERAALQWRNLAQGNKTTADSFAVSQALSEIGRSFLLASPVTTVMCYLVRCGSILTFPLNLALKPPAGVEVDRLESVMKGVIYLLLCIGVLARILHGRLTFEQVYFPLACTLALLLATTPQIDPRFRVPMIPLLLVVALLPANGWLTQRSSQGNLLPGKKASNHSEVSDVAD